MKIPAIFKKDKTWTVVAAIASAVAAIAALIAIIQTNSIFELRRPYLKIYEAKMQRIDETNTFSFKIGLENIGMNPIRDPEMKLLVKNKILDEDLFGVFYRFADDIPPGGKLSYVKKDINLSKIKDDTYYVILIIRYNDPIFQKDFAQLFLFRWDTKLIGFQRVLVAERNKIFKNQDLKLPLSDKNIIRGCSEIPWNFSDIRSLEQKFQLHSFTIIHPFKYSASLRF